MTVYVCHKLSVLLVVGALLSSCIIPTTSLKRHIRYNPVRDAYEETVFADTLRSRHLLAWHVVRHPETGVKAVDSLQAAAWAVLDTAKKSVSGPATRAGYGSVYQQYANARTYFKGIARMREGEYQHALRHFGRAYDADSTLRDVSDINYLRAICHHNSGHRAEAQKCFTAFRTYSSQVCAPSFYLDESTVSRIRIRDLVESGYRATGFDSSHYGMRYDGPALYVRPIPGLNDIPAVRQRGRAVLGAGYDGDGLLGVIGLEQGYTTGFMLSFRWIFGKTMEKFRTRYAYQVYLTACKRYGINAALEAALISDADDTQGRRLPQLSIRLNNGWYPHPRLGVYAGGAYHYFNQWNKYESVTDGETVYLWQQHDLYAGGVVLLTDTMGLSALYHLEYGVLFGVYIGGIELFLNKMDYFN